MNRGKAINIKLEIEEKCLLDDAFPTCEICGEEMEQSVNIDINKTKTLKLCNRLICINCAIDIANKIFNLEVTK